VIRRLVVPKELGDGIEVRLLQWYKAEGDLVAADDALLEFETDKAIVLVTAKEVGSLRRCFCAAGDWMKPGDVAAWLSDEPDEPLPAERDAPAEVLLVTFDAT
jgi:pyruvate/2-oxoglutarate dehydrogenase complex dihydrolipoamide acyltransferase (E2) component